MPITAGMMSAASGLKNPAGAVELGYRVNLCTNPNFETNTSFWAANGAGVSIEASTDAFYDGTKSLKVTLDTGSFTGTVFGNSGRIAVTPGQSYRYSLYIKTGPDNEVSSYRLRVRTFTALSGGTTISNLGSTAVEFQPNSEWTRLSFAPVITDPGIAAVTLLVDRTTSTVAAGDFFYIDNVLFEKSATLNNYFDGNSVGAFWGGAQNGSISGTSPY
jgi:hypothetical protein